MGQLQSGCQKLSAFGYLQLFVVYCKHPDEVDTDFYVIGGSFEKPIEKCNFEARNCTSLGSLVNFALYPEVFKGGSPNWLKISLENLPVFYTGKYSTENVDPLYSARKFLLPTSEAVIDFSSISK